MNRAIDAARFPYYEVWDTLADLAQPLLLDRLVRHDTPRVPVQAFVDRARREALADLIRQGLLVELHHAEYGQWPASLDELRETLGGALPMDPFSGVPYIYWPTSQGFVLYSVGVDGRDDGGAQSDLVWRPAATQSV